jgi:prolipoprotein diacylglyceryl transferase
MCIRDRSIQTGRPSPWYEIIPGVVLSSVFAWKLFGIVFQYPIFAANPQKYLLSDQGSIIAMIIVIAVSVAYHLYKYFTFKRQAQEIQEETIHPYQNTWNILIIAVISALIGSKLFDIIDNFSSFLRNPVQSLVSFNGLTFYGGFIVTVVVLILYMRVIKLDWKQVIDSTAPVIMIGYAVGRLGCHFSGDGCWGVVNTLPQPHWIAWLPDWIWASSYPHNVINRGTLIPGCSGPHCMVLDKPVFPTSLYESFISFFLFGILWLMRKKIKAPVVLFGLFMILNGTERFLIEKIRINNKYDVLGMQLSQAEMISAFLIFAGITIMLYFSYKHKSETMSLRRSSPQKL